MSERPPGRRKVLRSGPLTVICALALGCLTLTGAAFPKGPGAGGPGVTLYKSPGTARYGGLFYIAQFTLTGRHGHAFIEYGYPQQGPPQCNNMGVRFYQPITLGGNGTFRSTLTHGFFAGSYVETLTGTRRGKVITGTFTSTATPVSSPGSCSLTLHYKAPKVSGG